MAINRLGVGILLVVFSLAGWQVWNLASSGKPEVLSAVTTKTLEERVASLESRVYVLEKNAGLITSASKKTTESFVSLSGGDIGSFEWSKISGTDFTLDTSLYGKTVEVSWQGWLSGAGSIRLYDSTNHRAVDYSEFASTSGSKVSFYSKALSIWRGQNQYYIEGKTIGGTVTISSPRLKIVAK
ncbi:hypothetical protein D4S03_05065 [bacterium]|nr:MAG: hypothetical protein D4S03_05065 [bacterium]